MIIRKEWFINEFVRVLFEYIFSVIVFSIISIISAFGSDSLFIKQYIKLINDMLNLGGFYYVYKVVTKKSWITKEIFVSLGGLYASIIVNNSTGIVLYMLAILVSVLRKIDRFLSSTIL